MRLVINNTETDPQTNRNRIMLIDDATFDPNVHRAIERPKQWQQFGTGLSDSILVKDKVKQFYDDHVAAGGVIQDLPSGDQVSVEEVLCYTLPNVILSPEQYAKARSYRLTQTLIDRANRWECLRQKIANVITDVGSQVQLFRDVELYNSRYINGNQPDLILWFTNGAMTIESPVVGNITIDHTADGFSTQTYYLGNESIVQIAVDILTTGKHFIE